MNREEQRRRDEQIALDRLLGWSEADAAAKYRVSVRTVRRAYYRWKQDCFKIEDFDPVEAICGYLLRLDRMASDLVVDRNSKKPMVRINAMMAQLRVWMEQTRVQMEVGVLPRLEKGSDGWRQEHAAQIHLWLRDLAKQQGLAPEFSDWIADGLEDWLKHAPKGLWSE